jgi:hypothetical protein
MQARCLFHVTISLLSLFGFMMLFCLKKMQTMNATASSLIPVSLPAPKEMRQSGVIITPIYE